jgi:hypothetical protein
MGNLQNNTHSSYGQNVSSIKPKAIGQFQEIQRVSTSNKGQFATEIGI